jgi:activator of 2-hydroxyglutaryl-CoA dehydratase
VVSLLSEGEPLEDIVAGLHDAIASRVASMARKLKIEPDVVFTGGVAKNPGVAKALKEALGCEIYIPDEPLLSGALGAALLAREAVVNAIEKGEPVHHGEHRLEEATFFGGE